MQKTILIYCEESGAFADLYRAAGYNVIVKDIIIDPVNGDIRFAKHYIKEKIYGALFFPPCTDFAVSGARWFAIKGPDKLASSLALVDACLRVVALHYRTLKFWALENPVGRLVQFIGKPPVYFNPYEYAGYTGNTDDAYSKKTCLWGSFIMPPPETIAEYTRVKNAFTPSVSRESKVTQ